MTRATYTTPFLARSTSTRFVAIWLHPLVEGGAASPSRSNRPTAATCAHHSTRPSRSTPPWRALLHRGDGCLDEGSDLIGMGGHHHVARGDLDDRGAHALREQPLGVRRDGLVLLRDHVPRRQVLPRRC